MLKKTISLILSFVIVFSFFSVTTVTANAEMILDSGQCGDNVYYTLYADGKLVISGTGDIEDGSVLDDYVYDINHVEIENGVTSIGEHAFYGYKNLVSITIPGSVKSIDDWAFTNCTSLTSLTIFVGVTSIGDFAFARCESLTSIEIPDSVTSIGESAFSTCTNLTSITIPDSVISIGSSAFEDCDSLTSITIPDSVISIGDFAFGNCDVLDAINVDRNNSVYSSIDGVLFDKKAQHLHIYPYGKKDSDYIIPDGVTNIGNAFQYCDSLTSITIPGSVTSIGNRAFIDCDNLISVTILDGVTRIGDSAFISCDSLRSVTILDDVTSIGEYAFYCCGNLRSVTIPDSVISIDYYAFDGCFWLTDVYYTGTEEQWNQINIDYGNDDLTDATIHYNPSEDIPKYPLGDVSNDNVISIVDATEIQKYLAGLTTLTDFQITKGDVNNDGVLSVIDATEIQKYLAGISSSL